MKAFLALFLSVVQRQQSAKGWLYLLLSYLPLLPWVAGCFYRWVEKYGSMPLPPARGNRIALQMKKEALPFLVPVWAMCSSSLNQSMNLIWVKLTRLLWVSLTYGKFPVLFASTPTPVWVSTCERALWGSVWAIRSCKTGTTFWKQSLLLQACCWSAKLLEKGKKRRKTK